jgi:hypothetical protein
MMMNKELNMTENVTFQTILVPSRETPKAYCVLGGSYLPKSLVTAGPVLIERRLALRPGSAKTILTHVVEVTMPKWLATK